MSSDRFQHIRLLEAILFASAEPMRPQELARFLPEDCEIGPLLEELAQLYANRGVNLIRVGERWAFRSAQDLAQLMRIEKPVRRKLSRAAVETLAIIAYHQPVTRAEVEEIRGVGLSKGTLDSLLEIGWIKPKGRRRTPGRPVTWGTTDTFLDQFGLETLDSLPGQEELKAAGLLDARPAIAALGARGLLPTEGEAQDGAEEEDSVEGEDAAELLAADFGEELVAEGEAAEAAAEEDEPEAPAADEATAPDEARDETEEEPTDGELAEASGEAEEDSETLVQDAAAQEADSSRPDEVEAAEAEAPEQGADASNGHAEPDRIADEDSHSEAPEELSEHSQDVPHEAPEEEAGSKAMAGVEEHESPLGRVAAAPGAKLLT